MVIVEYCKYGNLSNYLKSKRNLFCPNKVRRQMVLVGFILPDVSVDNVDVSSELISSDSLLPKERNDFWVKFSWPTLIFGVGCVVPRGDSPLSPWLCKETAVTDLAGAIYSEGKWILSKVSPCTLALLLMNPFLVILRSAKPKEVVLPTYFSTAGSTNKIIPIKSHVPWHLNIQRFTSNLIIVWEELSRGKEIRVLSSHPTALWIKFIICFLLQTFCFYKPNFPENSNCSRKKVSKGSRALAWDLGAWIQNSSSAEPKPQQHLRDFFGEGSVGALTREDVPL